MVCWFRGSGIRDSPLHPSEPLFGPGVFSLVVASVSGRGSGLAAASERVERFGGNVSLARAVGAGAVGLLATLSLPSS